MSFGIFLFIAAILIVVMIHEAGHFFVAKAFDFKATKFFVGFGPTLLSTQRGETEYGVKAFPLGGFVKIVGMNPYEEVSEEDRPRSYGNKPRWQRALVLVAGSATHWVVAFLLLLVTAMAIGFPTGEATTTVSGVTRSLGNTTTPAGETDLGGGDTIVAIDGVEVESWDDVSTYIKERPGEEITMRVERDGNVRTVVASIGSAVFEESSGEVVAYAPPGEDVRAPRDGEVVGGFFGISPEAEYRREALPGAVKQAGVQTWQLTYYSVRGIGQVFSMVFDGTLWDALTGDGERRADEGPLGLVGAGRIAGETVARGQYLDFIGLIVGFTVFVGLMNLLPLPPLDGGHLAVVAWEAVSGKEVDVRKLIPVTAAVISFFVVLFLAVLYLDLARPVELPF